MSLSKQSIVVTDRDLSASSSSSLCTPASLEGDIAMDEAVPVQDDGSVDDGRVDDFRQQLMFDSQFYQSKRRQSLLKLGVDIGGGPDNGGVPAQDLDPDGVPAADEEHHRHGFAVPSTAEEIEGAQLRWGEGAWQMRALRIVNSDGVQRFLVALLILDVFILFSELAIDAFVPSCKLIVRDATSCCPAYEADDIMHRILGGGGGDDEVCKYPLAKTEYQAGCDYHKYPGVHVAHKVLFWLTVVILSSFEIELLFLIYLIGPKIFFGQLTYVVDFVVVTLSLALEIMLKYASKEVLEVLPGILIVFRLWRFVRIGHGLVASTYEVQEQKIHLAVEYIEELEGKLRRAGRKSFSSRPKNLTMSVVKRLSTVDASRIKEMKEMM